MTAIDSKSSIAAYLYSVLSAVPPYDLGISEKTPPLKKNAWF